MELLLNLLWLLLVIPAALVWREARRAQPQFDSRRTFLLLACVLILLFPIISASDDLQAMRPEVEESSARDALRHQSVRACAHTDHLNCGVPVAALPAAAAPAWSLAWQVLPPAERSLLSGFLTRTAGRSPPTGSLS